MGNHKSRPFIKYVKDHRGRKFCQQRENEVWQSYSAIMNESICYSCLTANILHVCRWLSLPWKHLTMTCCDYMPPFNRRHSSASRSYYYFLLWSYSASNLKRGQESRSRKKSPFPFSKTAGNVTCTCMPWQCHWKAPIRFWTVAAKKNAAE